MASWIPGDVVLTSFGVGVIVSVPSKLDQVSENVLAITRYEVRLWRGTGKSIASTAKAYLQPDAIILSLPAAPGMTTNLLVGEEKVSVQVHTYCSSSHSYLISPEATPDQYTQVDASRLMSASSAKFYPLLVQLMKRGDETVQATTALIQDENLNNIVQKGTKYIETKSSQAANFDAKESVHKIASTVSQNIHENLPKDEEVKQVYNMLRDEELTVLLRKGQDRLQELMATDISKATTDALRKTGILIADTSIDDSSTFAQAVAKSRDSALASLQALLHEAEVSPDDLDAVRGKLETSFTEMFDSFANAAKSDRTLASIFETISGKTSEWQEATGRLMTTKSGSLFMEGATRLQQRAKDIFSHQQIDWAGQVGSKLTKAFTEGDAAVARLKSLEMGDAVRARLVDAIEVRSGSQGGLDGIIAGALTTISSTASSTSSTSGEQMQQMLTKLQTNASSATSDARETLISVLSNRSQYQEIALLRVERVLCDLDSQLGEEMTPAEIAAIASGEGGTAALFDPIAKRASKEISRHLDQAESTITDPAMVTGLQHVRRIISGELTVSGLMDEVVTILNDDKILAAGENLVKSGEIALDAIEGISGNKIAGDVMEIAEKAGITKESVMSQLEALNVNDLLDTAGNAVTDEKARRELVSSATDTALDFVLRILPSMPVPPFDGVKDGLLYSLSNLSMQGFKVKKEDIVVEIAGMRATKHTKPNIPVGGVSTTTIDSTSHPSSGSIPPFKAKSSFESFEVDMTAKNDHRAVKATELLIIDVQGISAVLEGVAWSFEQTYMPYLKGSGKANVRLSDGSLRLQFELRKLKKTTTETGEILWEPVLCLHDRACAIKEVDLTLQGESRLTWIFNKLASVFKNVLRDYVVKTIISILTSKSGYILEQLNSNLAPYWSLILRTTGLSMDELVEADDKVIMAAQPDEDEGLVELVWRENLPLGMNLLLNDDSGKLKVVDFPRGSQARSVCEKKEIDPLVFNGATIVAVNGSRYEYQEDLFDALKNPSRPKSILFELANPEDAARVKDFVEGSRNRSGRKKQSTKKQEVSTPRVFSTNEVIFDDDKEVGLEFMTTPDDYGLAVKEFLEGDGGIVLAAERKGTIARGDILTHVNGQLVLGESGKGRQRALELLEKEGNARPLSLTFAKSYIFHKLFEKPAERIADVGGPVECMLKEQNKRIVLYDFENASGTAESGGVLIGDHLIFVNGEAVGAGCNLTGQFQRPELNDIYDTLKEPSNYPVALTFARPKKQTGSRWSSQDQKFVVETAETICVTADNFEQIGCVFESKKNLDITVTDLFAVPGPVQLAMRHHIDSAGSLSLSVESINGQFVPSYASTSIVMNAMKRSWATNGKVEIVFCDDELKEWVRKLT